MSKKLDKLVEEIVCILDPTADKELIQEAQQKASEVFNPSVSEFLDQLEITIGKNHKLKDQEK
ncbi:MAG: hypothetical protein ACFFAU_21130 [Candidatus Hodarchaeota archaeon]